MKGKIISLVVLLAVLGGIFGVVCVENIPVGHVGVVYSPTGVEDEVLTKRWNVVAPWKAVKEFPIAQQQLVLSNNPEDYNEDKHADWSIDAPADGGMVTINMTVNYNFMADRITDLYERFSGMDGDEIVENMVQNSIIAYVKEVTPQFSVMDIYSSKRSEVSKEITTYLNQKLSEEYGIEVKSALIIDAQLDATLKEKVQAKEQAKQDAEKAELDKQTALAQAEVAKANAEAAAEVKRIEAEAAAAQTLIAAEAEAKANKLKSESITQALIDMKEAEAREKHGWVEIQTSGSVVTTTN